MRGLNALVVDDSSLNRRAIAAILREIEGVGEVALACDGAEALRLVEVSPPDFITLDLEMPRLDGYEFLQLLMDRHPLPVVVVSGRSGKEDVFRALELGAIDFLIKPLGDRAPLESLRRQLVEKVFMIRRLSPLALRRGATGGLLAEPGALDSPARRKTSKRRPGKVVVIGASTGGPKALISLLRQMHEDLDAAWVIAQHMPPRFTRSFADRLDRAGVLRVSEARRYERLVRGHAYVCPGGRSVEIVPSLQGPVLRVVTPATGAHYVPSVDQLFFSAARALGTHAVAVVLTGMGDDGAQGVVEIVEHGGAVLIQDPRTAVVSGMPMAVRRTNVRHESLEIWTLGARIAELTRARETAAGL